MRRVSRPFPIAAIWTRDICVLGENSDILWETLLERARAGCPEALGKILEPYRAYLLGTADRDLGDDLQAKDGASDLVQETFFEAVRGFERFKGQSPHELEHWLSAILGFRLVDFVRRYRQSGKRQVSREVRLETQSGDNARAEQLAAHEKTPRSQAIAQEEAYRLWRAMEALPERDAKLLRLRDQEGLSFGEIGDVLGVSAGAARKSWVRALRQLRRLLNPVHGARTDTANFEAVGSSVDSSDDTPGSSSGDDSFV